MTKTSLLRPLQITTIIDVWTTAASSSSWRTTAPAPNSVVRVVLAVVSATSATTTTTTTTASKIMTIRFPPVHPLQKTTSVPRSAASTPTTAPATAAAKRASF